jgi:hypothetical protein
VVMLGFGLGSIRFKPGYAPPSTAIYDSPIEIRMEVVWHTNITPDLAQSGVCNRTHALDQG